MKKALFALSLGSTLFACSPVAAPPVDKLTYHNTPGRSGWNDDERVLTPRNVNARRFGLIWQSPELDPFGEVPARLFASPLFMSAVKMADGRRMSMAFVATTTGYAYGIASGASDGATPGDIVWRKQLTTAPCEKGTMGNLSTPVIDAARNRIYVTSCSGTFVWHVHALDLRTGAELAGWPVEISAATMPEGGPNRNGTKGFVAGGYYFQRGALNLSADGGRLYVAFGPDMQGWLVSVDTKAKRIASAFSSTRAVDEEQGGMWGSSGPAIDAQGRIHIATGASFMSTLANKGIPGVFPDSPHSWGQSILQFTDGPAGLRLNATYSPYNYCQTAAKDIDIGGSGAVLIDLKSSASQTRSATPHLLALGGAKQGNVYLLDRDHMPGNAVQRHGCSTDPTTDKSLLAPEIQKALGTRGPVNVFGPFSDDIGMINQAKSRSTLAHYRDHKGGNYLFVSGSAKTGPDFGTNVPPGLVRVKVETPRGKPAFLRIAGQEMTQTLQNPGSPVVSSNRGRDGIVWLMDPNAPRSVDLFQRDAPPARLYAFDATTLKLLWKSGDEMFTSGKYNEPAVVNGTVLVGTDRLQAFGLRGGKPMIAARAVARPVAPAGKTLFQNNCASCHSLTGTNAPNQKVISQHSAAEIRAILTTGKMKELASQLSAEQKAQVADYLAE